MVIITEALRGKRGKKKKKKTFSHMKEKIEGSKEGSSF